MGRDLRGLLESGKLSGLWLRWPRPALLVCSRTTSGGWNLECLAHHDCRWARLSLRRLMKKGLVEIFTATFNLFALPDLGLRHARAGCPQRAEEGARSWETELQMLGIEPRSSTEQPVFLAAEPSLQTYCHTYWVQKLKSECTDLRPDYY